LLLLVTLALLLVGIWLARPVQADGPIRVDADATCGVSCDGTSWGSAYPSLQDALDQAAAGDEIWVATGVYTPGVTVADTFSLPAGVALYGGFVATETLRSQRDWQNNVTVLSGDIDGDDQTDAHGVITHTDHITGSNSTHVVTSQGVNDTAVLDGFTLTGGDAHGSHPNDAGGGMFNEDSSPTVRNVTFSGNRADTDGGGMYNDNSSPALTNVTFSGNTANVGGGIYNWESSNPTLTNVSFSSNNAVSDGGGMYNWTSNPALTNVSFSGNNAMSNNGGGMANWNGSSPALTNVSFGGNTAGWGGGMYNSNFSNPTLTNVTFSGNTASVDGGGMHNWTSDPTLTNVTFSGNTASVDGGGMANWNGSSPALTNCILWGNTAANGAQIYNDGSPTISYNLVEGGCPAESTCDHLIDADPQFVHNPDPGDGDWTTPDDNDYGDLRLQLTSPAINAGDNSAPGLVGVTTDLAGQRRIQGGTVDMGAYEAPSPVYLPLILKNQP
jgi:hypothetical protein